METYNFDGGSHQMIINQLQLSEDIQLVTERLDALETRVETLISGQQLIIGTLNQIVKKNKSNKKPPVQRKKRQQPSARPSDVSKLLHLPEALQRNIQIFTDTVLLSSTDIPDELISTDCLSEDECSTLLSKTSKKDQVRLLIRKIKARGPQVIEKFLNIVGKDHPHLPIEVNKSLEVIVKEYKFKPVCVICVMQSTVDLRDIGENLWAEKIISDDIFGDIYESDSLYRNKPFIWSKIINSLNGYENPDEAKYILIKALKTKYDHIVEYLNENPDRQSLSCSCCTRRRLRARPTASYFGSQTDLSTTSAVIPKIVFDDEFSEDGQSVASSQGIPGSNVQSYDLLEYFDNIEHLEKQRSETDGKVSCTSDETADNKNHKRHFSESFEPQVEKEESNTLNKPFLCLGESPNSFIGNDERPELKHSVSIVSNASTVRATQSPDRDLTIEETDLEDGIRIKHQEQFTSYGKGCDNENDQVDFHIANDESEPKTDTDKGTTATVVQSISAASYGNEVKKEINAQKDKQNPLLADPENDHYSRSEINAGFTVQNVNESFPVNNENPVIKETKTEKTLKDIQKQYEAGYENDSIRNTDIDVPSQDIQEQLTKGDEEDSINEADANVAVQDIQQVQTEFPADDIDEKDISREIKDGAVNNIQNKLPADNEITSSRETTEHAAVTDIQESFLADEYSSSKTKVDTEPFPVDS